MRNTPRTGLMVVGVCMATLTAIFTVSIAGANRPVVQRITRGCNAGCAFDVAGGGISDFDSIQVIGSGILRGYKDTRSIFISPLRLTGVLGLPSGYILALTDLVVEPMGPAGSRMALLLA